jgi:hypothetical protein
VFPYSFAGDVTHIGAVTIGIWEFFPSDFAVWAVFVLCGVASIGVIVGWYTRYMMVLLLLTVSLIDARNPLVLSVADSFLHQLLLFAVFLPVGKRWSIDSITSQSNVENQSRSVVGVATAGILFQIAYFYFNNGRAKLFNESLGLTEGVKLIIEYDVESFAHVELLNVLPSPVLSALGAIWVLIMVFSPILLLTTTGYTRSISTVPFILGHLAIGFGFRIGLFPYITIAALLLFISDETWDVITNITSVKSVLSIPLHTLSISTALDAIRDGVESALDVSPSQSDGSNQYISLSTVNNTVTLLLIFMIITSTVSAVGASSDSGVRTTIKDTGESLGLVQPAWSFFTTEAAFKDFWYVYKVNTTTGETGDWYNNRSLTFERPYTGSKLHYQHETYRVHFYESKINTPARQNAFNERMQYICATESFNESDIGTIQAFKVVSPYNMTNRFSTDRNTTITQIGNYTC